jgi:hypothetical protein
MTYDTGSCKKREINTKIYAANFGVYLPLLRFSPPILPRTGGREGGIKMSTNLIYIVLNHDITLNDAEVTVQSSTTKNLHLIN